MVEGRGRDGRKRGELRKMYSSKKTLREKKIKLKGNLYLELSKMIFKSIKVHLY